MNMKTKPINPAEFLMRKLLQAIFVALLFPFPSAWANAIAPAITTSPTTQLLSLGSPGQMTVAATGTAPLTYQWYCSSTTWRPATSAIIN